MFLRCRFMFLICRFMFLKCLAKTTPLIPDIRRINMIEYWENYLAVCFLTLEDVQQLVKTPTRTCIVV
ncbi:hypothetical protein RchiOBHm_Chr7g0234141 [Rosa chinensis]|uniref:Secreted protein n=1 Tax=Rosa chinensis TaxID=74649 RepID=A0A2P6PGC4_ROSCH|nr:hypothetical protein RchiOBHm_Chr7g0234141 [Rosa chinensis]